MRTEIRTKTVEYKVYIASDGKEFTEESLAEDHEKILNGIRKKCDNCKGNGRVNGRWEVIQWDYGTKKDNVWKDEKCDVCDGKGYLERKWV